MTTATATTALLPTEISIPAIREALIVKGIPVFARRTISGQDFTLYADDRYPQVFTLPDNNDVQQTSAARKYASQALVDLRTITGTTHPECGPLTDAERDLVRMYNQAVQPNARPSACAFCTRPDAVLLPGRDAPLCETCAFTTTTPGNHEAVAFRDTPHGTVVVCSCGDWLPPYSDSAQALRDHQEAQPDANV